MDNVTKVLITSWLGFFTLTGCSSNPVVQEPAWIHDATRRVDGGYIVYIGSDTGSNPERAAFRAEGMALEDLANECSMIPKGTRIEDRFNETSKNSSKAYVKIGVEFQACEEMKKAIEPDQIRKIGNIAFTEQLKRYQDLNETGEIPDKTTVTEIEPPEVPAQAPERAQGWSESTHFYVTRQYIAYQKEVVVLAPPNAYPPDSTRTKNLVAALQPATSQVQLMEKQNPSLQSQPVAWSKLPDRPKIERPQTLAKSAQVARAQSQAHTLSSPPHAIKGRNQQNHGPQKTAPKPQLKRGKKRRFNQPPGEAQ